MIDYFLTRRAVLQHDIQYRYVAHGQRLASLEYTYVVDSFITAATLGDTGEIPIPI